MAAARLAVSVSVLLPCQPAHDHSERIRCLALMSSGVVLSAL